jgi:hypothetical protein
MSRESVRARGQARAQEAQVDTCTIRRLTGKTVGAGGVITKTWTQLYAGPCRVQIPGIIGTGSGEDVGEAYRVIERRSIQLPMSLTGLAEGDELTIVTAADDADLVGKRYTLRDIPAKTDATSRRVTALEVTS